MVAYMLDLVHIRAHRHVHDGEVCDLDNLRPHINLHTIGNMYILAPAGTAKVRMSQNPWIYNSINQHAMDMPRLQQQFLS
mmetsp:Transcript_16108/g.28217  ORF Transcript_16108/g.28217 Transcript_16108/m.28217 type:complete len:80 (+) Transcript_16108:221-460(+)